MLSRTEETGIAGTILSAGTYAVAHVEVITPLLQAGSLCVSILTGLVTTYYVIKKHRNDQNRSNQE